MLIYLILQILLILSNNSFSDLKRRHGDAVLRSWFF